MATDAQQTPHVKSQLWLTQLYNYRLNRVILLIGPTSTTTGVWLQITKNNMHTQQTNVTGCQVICVWPCHALEQNPRTDAFQALKAFQMYRRVDI